MPDDVHGQYRPDRSELPALFAKANNWLIAFLGVFSVSFIAMTRRRPGYHTVAPGRYIPVAVTLFFWHDVASFIVNSMVGGFINMIGMGFIRFPYVWIPNSPTLQLFALIMPIAGFVKRRKAWNAFFRDGGWHTYSNGSSYLCYLLPWVRPDRVNRFLDPAACAFLGYWLYQDDYGVMGVWLMISAIAVAWSEQVYFEWVLASQFVRHNAVLIARMQDELLGGIRTSMARRARLRAGLHALLKGLIKLLAVGVERARPAIEKRRPVVEKAVHRAVSAVRRKPVAKDPTRELHDADLP